MLFRFLLITGIIFYLIYKIGSLFFRAGAASQQLRDLQRRNLDNVNGQSQKAKQSGRTKTGEYIDFEEVK